MVNRCAFCSSGRKSYDYSGPYFSFPSEKSNPALRQQWLDALPVVNYTPAKSARLCSLHFDPLVVETERKDQRGDRAVLGELQLKYLKKDAVPQIWPGYPEYVSKDIPKRRSGTSSADARAEKEKYSQLEIDQVSSIQDLRDKLTTKLLPVGVYEVLDGKEGKERKGRKFNILLHGNFPNTRDQIQYCCLPRYVIQYCCQQY